MYQSDISNQKDFIASQQERLNNQFNALETCWRKSSHPIGRRRRGAGGSQQQLGLELGLSLSVGAGVTPKGQEGRRRREIRPVIWPPPG